MPTIRTGTGAEVWARDLAQGLRLREHTVDLQILPHWMQFMPWAAGKPEKTPDITVANSWTAAAHAGPGPLVTVMHHVVHDESLDDFKSPYQRFYHRAMVLPMELSAVERSAALVTVSEHAAAQIRRKFGPVACEVVHNGVDIDFFTPGPPRRRTRPFELLFVGKPSRRKAFDVVQEAVARIGSDYRLTVVGSEPEAGLRIDPATRHLGRVSRERLRDAYRSADLLVFPSRLEGFGYAAAEAMACGTPVLCTADSAVAEIVGAEAGIVVNSLDPQVIGRAVREIALPSERLARLGTAARDRIERRFSRSRWLDDMEGLLLRVAR